MTPNQLISIIVPCYNQSQYLDECLQSVLDQTYQNWECIIVNDGSKDDTEEIALKWIVKDNRFKYISKENGGVASARNYGIRKCKGEWILPLDGDDKINIEYLSKAQTFFTKDIDLIYSNSEFFGEVTGVWNLENYNYFNLLQSNMIFCSAFFRKTSWEKASGYDPKLIYGYEDWEFWISILNENSKVIKLDYLGFYYRRKLESRDILINKDVTKKDKSYNYIYTKHLDKYLQFSKNAIINFKIINQKLKNHDEINSKLKKNIITKVLFRVIQAFSKST
ncbi:glycosyltransferase family A protein [Soonwooa sp.]|uniref:glycosyltransferase family 2 protein n=1 Tax=Soonwooa sp. TaxID=1938592 RepID=UPI00289F26FE|nr:glycosyltransferase family A protein [Soonwooa sp.]